MHFKLTLLCPFCKNQSTDVIETRDNSEALAVRRRRECQKCQKRFTTYEKIEEIPIMVVKKDGRREKFIDNKLRQGIVEACVKTKVSYGDIEKIIEEVVNKIYSRPNMEIESKEIGNVVAEQLKKIDKVAYIRFASVFREFVDLGDFKKELKRVG